MFHVIPMYSSVSNKRSSLVLKMLHTIGKEAAATYLVAVFLKIRKLVTETRQNIKIKYNKYN